MKMEEVKSGQWVQPVRKGYLMACCDCGLIHRLNFRLVKRGRGQSIQLQAFRAGRVDKSGRVLLKRGGEVLLAATKGGTP